MAMKPIEILINAKDNASLVFDSLRSKVAAVGVAILGYFGVQAFAGAVKGAADFEQAMSRVQSATGASAAEMASLRKASEDASASTKFTSTEAAGALENLAKAGLSAKDAIAALPAVLNLAQAGDIDLGQASEFVTKAVMGMGLAFTDAGRVADVLALGANATNTSVTGLAQALSYAAPVAQSLGLSLESTVAIIGKFADAGIDASRAGTALNGILSQFSDPASKFRQELGAAGITTNNFEEALHQLAKAGPTGAKAINAVGQEAGPALRALLNQGMPALDELTQKLKGAEGAAAAAAKVMNDNLNGSLASLDSAWRYVKNTLSTPVLPVLRDGVDQLAAAFRSAVADGTVQKFGEAIATSFKAGIKWVREFIAQADLKQITADMRAFADRSGEVFTQIGEYATNAGNIVKTVYGVMSAGTNAVLGSIYALGSAFASIVAGVQSGLAVLYEAFSKVTFGALSAQYKAIAAEIRESSAATSASAQALSDKSSAALLGVASAAQLARSGFVGLYSSMKDGKPVADTTAKAIDDVGAKLEATRQKSRDAQKATEDKKAADVAATIATRQLKDEYAALIASGDMQAAAEKQQAINRALQATPAAAKDAVKAAQDAAKATAEAFAGLGIDSQASLKLVASSAKVYYDRIKADGTSTAVDIANAFKAYAEKAIAANNGVATETLKSEAAMRGFEIQVDSAGKSVVKAMGDGRNATDALTGSIKLSAEAVKAQEEAFDRMEMRYRLRADYTERQIALEEKELALLERKDALERKRLAIDKDGFSVDKSGNRIVATESQTQLNQRVGNQYGADFASDERAIQAANITLQINQIRAAGALGTVNSPEIAALLAERTRLEAELSKARADAVAATRAVQTSAPAPAAVAVPSPAPVPVQAPAPAPQVVTYLVKFDNGTGRTADINVVSANDATTLIAALQNARLSAS